MLCGAVGTRGAKLYYVAEQRPNLGREYYRCASCSLLFVPEAYHVSPDTERAIYDLHENDPADLGYRQFLSQLTKPLCALLAETAPEAAGLDFGAGPGPAIPLMLSAAGYPCAIYDIYYANEPARLQQQYDFVTATEVVEHLADPQQVISQLVDCLRPGGLLALMTQIWSPTTNLSKWRYLQDPTHITFYSAETFVWMARHWALEIRHESRNVIIFQKPTE